MRNISLQEMYNILTDNILKNKEQPTLYYKREWIKDKPEYVKITEVDLMRGRFKTIDDDFSEYEWELENSNIYIEDIQDEIYVNEYIRSTDGYIGRILEIIKRDRVCDTYYKTDKAMASGYYEHIEKHSFILRDLLKIGDIILIKERITKTLGFKLEELRKQKNLTRKELAKELGITEKAIYNYEKTERIPATTVLNLYSKYFNIPIEYFTNPYQELSNLESLVYISNETDLERIKENLKINCIIKKIITKEQFNKVGYIIEE